MQIEPDMQIEPESLFGKWQATTASLGGAPMPEGIISSTSLTLSAEQYLVDLAGAMDRGSCEIQLGTQPIQMKISGEEAPNAGKTFYAILEFLGSDEIRIAYDLSGTEYPKSFEPTSAQSNYVATFKKC